MDRPIRRWLYNIGHDAHYLEFEETRNVQADVTRELVRKHKILSVSWVEKKSRLF